ncbi:MULTISPECIES: MFS transporter [unclassified Dyella]|uniref:MFS transporter n=1 Tax=unclassified Dyella TaxID=2634549 RepID=UPI000C81B447|nr:MULTISPECIES: MFS transporter [unclassified Dyella]MDR3446230.1 MFS transporter [Dyella sp.]PMQ02689.1 Inner membrane protein YbjJ [Dyella sp. AD56]
MGTPVDVTTDTLRSQAVSTLPAAKRATRLIFLVSGIGMSVWAPMVPYAKARLGLDDAQLGLALLAFGGGSMLSMPFVGWLAHRLGNRTVIVVSGLLMCAALPALAMVSSIAALVAALLYFGVMLGAVDVAMNAHAVDVERHDGGRLMSGFHGLFSLGGLTGAAVMSGLLAVGVSLTFAASAIAVLLVVMVLWLRSDLLDDAPAAVESRKEPLGMPHALAWLLGLLCFVSFLAEGAMLDWSAVFLRDFRGVSPASAGFGYACFSVAMATGRLTGDRIVGRYGPEWAVRIGAALAAVGFLLVACVGGVVVSLAGFVLIGLGASNIVPVMFSAAGRLPGTPPAIAIATATTLGYAGLLSGPALIGFVAHASSLPIAFVAVAGLLVLVGLSARIVKR